MKQTHAADDRTPLSFFPLRQIWTLTLDGPITAAPAFDATRGFFPLEGGQMAAYDLATATQLWMAPAPTHVQPAAGDDLVFVVEPGVLAALHAIDGTIAWELPFTEALAVPPIWDNGWLISVTAAGEVLAFRAKDGHLIWRSNVDAPAHARPALSGDRLYLPMSDSRVVALRMETGALVWEAPLGGAANDILALDNRLYLGSQDKYFYCLNTRDGAVEWKWPTGAAVIGLPVVDQRTVFFVSRDNVLRALNRSSGVQRWKMGVPLRPVSGPLKVADTLIVAGVSPTLRAFGALDGKAAGERSMAGLDLAAPPHLFAASPQSVPTLIVTVDLVKGTSVVALTRSFEPAIVPISPLPNLIVMSPPVNPPVRP